MRVASFLFAVAAAQDAPAPPSAPQPAAPAAAAAERDPTQKEIEEALASFENALPSIQEETAKALAAALDALPGGALKAARDRARAELKLVPRGTPPIHDPREFASSEFSRGRAPARTPVAPDSLEAAEKRERFRPQDNAPQFWSRCTWSIARDAALDWGAPVEPYGQVWNAMNGYLPDSDLLVAWAEKQLDFDESRDAEAAFFDHAYCDLQGRAYLDVTLYDAWSSGNGLEMPDVDQIAFARGILKDSSYVSPIPAGPRQTQLYTKIGDHFLAFFRYRVWIEAAANLWVNPLATLRDTHEGLRRPLVWLFESEQGDLARIAKRMKELGSREKFLAAMDAAMQADATADAAIARFEQRRAAERWPVARAAYAQLRERGMMAR